jgi:hypothetical protein
MASCMLLATMCKHDWRHVWTLQNGIIISKDTMCSWVLSQPTIAELHADATTVREESQLCACVCIHDTGTTAEDKLFYRNYLRNELNSFQKEYAGGPKE